MTTPRNRQSVRIRMDALEKANEALLDALIWCSGSDDFAPGGKAREGFEKIVLPLLRSEKGEAA